MEAWAKQYEALVNSPEAQEKIKHLANNQAHEWVNSKEFKQWQKEMELWAKEFAEAHQNAESSGDVFTPVPKHRPMPVMPPMPPMPADIVTPNVAAPVPPQPSMAVVPKVKPQTNGTSTVTSPAKIDGPTPVLPNTTGTKRNIEIKAGGAQTTTYKGRKFPA